MPSGTLRGRRVTCFEFLSERESEYSVLPSPSKYRLMPPAPDVVDSALNRAEAMSREVEYMGAPTRTCANNPPAGCRACRPSRAR